MFKQTSLLCFVHLQLHATSFQGFQGPESGGGTAKEWVLPGERATFPISS